MNEEKTLQTLEREFVEAGGNLSHYRLKEKFFEAEQLALQEQSFDEERLAEAQAKRPNWAKSAGEYAGMGLTFVSTLFTFVFVLLGLLVGTSFLMAAEFMAVFEGFSLVSPAHAWLYSSALVLFYVVVLFVEQILIDKHGQRQSKKPSLRLIASDAWYFFGGGKLTWGDSNVGSEWRERYNELPDETKQIKTTVTLLTWAIIVFGLLGRLRTELEIYKAVSWQLGLEGILWNSSLQTVIGYIAMFIATAALLWSNKWVVHFIYAQFRRVTGGVVVQDFSEASMVILSPVQRIEAARAIVLERELLRLTSGKKD